MKHNSRVLTSHLAAREGSRLRRGAFSLIWLLFLAVVGWSTPQAQAQTYTLKTLHGFSGGNDGVRPWGALVNVNGVLYGTTPYGGRTGYGTIYSINPDGTGYQTLYAFQATSSDGAYPYGNLTLVNGKLYGATYDGGAANVGTIFSFDPATSTETLLYSFQATSSSDGATPTGSMVSLNGVLYGTTLYGGSNDTGILFSFDPSSLTKITIHNFTNSGGDGANPFGGLLAANGLLYGTTQNGSSSNDGIVYSLDPTSGTEQILHTFTGPSNNGDGAVPCGGLVLLNNVLYGTSKAGGVNDGSAGYGTIYAINPDGTGFQTLYAFTDTLGDGAAPYTGLTAVNGLLYGTTTAGGPHGTGTTFAFDPTRNLESVIYGFSAIDSNGYNADGANSQATLIAINNTLYGTTYGGGTVGNTGTGYGTIFSLTPAPPVANNDSARTAYNTTLTVTAPGVLGNDKNATYATATLVSNPAHGTMTLHSNGSFVYVPTTGYLGTDSFTYQDTNAGGTGNVATCTITVQPRTPIAANDSGRTTFNTTLVIGAPGVLGNDKNGDNTALTAALVTNPSHGTITFNSDGSFTYLPTTGFLGTDSFTYQAVNDIGVSNTATCTMIVQARTPIASNDSGRTYFNTPLVVSAPGVLGNDKNGDSTPMTASLVTQPSHGTLSFHADGSFTYTPTSGFVGTDSFTYQASNDIGASNVATCTLTVQARTPIANNDNGRITHNHTLTITAPGVLGNDNAGDTGTITATMVTGPSHGTITFHNDGSFVYTPTTGFVGTDSFTYKDTNAVGTSNTATVTITVQ